MRYKSVTVDQERLVMLIKQWGIAWALCGLLFGLDQIGRLEWLKGGLERGFVQIDQHVHKTTVFIFSPLKVLQTSMDRTKRIADLEERLAHTAVEKARLHELESKIITLEALTTLNGGEKKASKVVRLIDYGDRVVLAVGSNDGVEVGQIVTDNANVLLGRVKEVGKYMSEVELLDDLGSKVAVEVTGGNTKGVVEGKGGRAELTGVLQSEMLGVHDVIVTSGIDEEYPPGLVIGQVVDLIGQPEDVLKGGIVELLAQRDEWAILW